MKITYYVASSLDGYIAKTDGDVSWLDSLDISMADTGYEEFYATVDGIVMGRKTYEMIVTFGKWPYGDKPTWVCSSKTVIPMKGCNLQMGNSPEEVYKAATKINITHLWLVGGGSLASSLITDRLLTHFYLSLMPIILGDGIKLFSHIPLTIKTTIDNEKAHKSGMVQLDYHIDYVE